MPDTPDYQRLQDIARRVAESPIGRIGITEYQLETGVVRGYGILTVPPGPSDLEPGGKVQYCEMHAGDAFPEHVQPHITEWLVVVNGRMEVASEDVAVVLAPGDGLRILPGVPHTATALTDCVVIGVTVPQDGGYPDGPTSGGPDGPGGAPDGADAGDGNDGV